MKNSLVIQTLKVGELQTNCYIVSDPDSKEAIIVDPGDSANYISDIVEKETLQPVHIIATHGHFDHILATFELKLMYKIPFLINKKDEFLVKRMSETAFYFLKRSIVEQPPSIDQGLYGGETIKIGEQALKVMETSGHTPGSVCLYGEAGNFLLTGDTIFSDGAVGRIDFKYSSGEDLTSSIHKVLTLPKQTRLYPGHGPETTVENELVYYKT